MSIQYQIVCQTKIELETVADKETQTEEVRRHTLSTQKRRKTFMKKAS